MSEQAAGEWRKVESQFAKGFFVIDANGRLFADLCTEAEIDAILRDHELAQDERQAHLSGKRPAFERERRRAEAAEARVRELEARSKNAEDRVAVLEAENTAHEGLIHMDHGRYKDLMAEVERLKALAALAKDLARCPHAKGGFRTLIPQAAQVYIRPGHVRRQATCPDHNRKSSDYRGGQQDFSSKLFWAFHCTGRGGHIFLALPDRTAPKTPEDADDWQRRQEAAQAGFTYPD